jgi:hypothetical protein
VSGRLPRWMPAWYVRPAPRILFQHQLAVCGVHVRRARAPRRHRGGFALTVKLRLPNIDQRTVTIVFAPAAPDIPHIYTDGPCESPHRYSDGSLCMWYPGDPAEERWIQHDGAAALLGHIMAHLIREEWWRRTGEWAGAEVPHLDVDNAASDPEAA